MNLRSLYDPEFAQADEDRRSASRPPTLEEIDAQRKQLQVHWSEAEFERRAGKKTKKYNFPRAKLHCELVPE